MNERLKALGGVLHRAYNAVLQRPLPWRMIDALVSLEEKHEQEGRDASERRSDSNPTALRQPEDRSRQRLRDDMQACDDPLSQAQPLGASRTSVSRTSPSSASPSRTHHPSRDPSRSHRTQ